MWCGPCRMITRPPFGSRRTKAPSPPRSAAGTAVATAPPVSSLSMAVCARKKNTTLSQIGSASKEKKKHNNNNRKGMNIIKDLIRYSPVPGGAGCSGTAATYEQKKKQMKINNKHLDKKVIKSLEIENPSQEGKK